MNKKKSIIFDLDGVIVDTAKFHFYTWRNLAKKLDIDFDKKDNEQLKGVSRIESLKKILQWGGKSISDEQFNQLMHDKNEAYLSYVDQMTADDILPGVMPILNFLKRQNVKMALGSASKNAKRILANVELDNFFDGIVDGLTVIKAKPDPEVFLKGAELLNVEPKHCLVFEDSIAGIEAANRANMLSIGIGNQQTLAQAKYCFNDFTEIREEFFIELGFEISKLKTK
jgi:beta-phosphoglucomutase